MAKRRHFTLETCGRRPARRRDCGPALSYSGLDLRARRFVGCCREPAVATDPASEVTREKDAEPDDIADPGRLRLGRGDERGAEGGGPTDRDGLREDDGSRPPGFSPARDRHRLLGVACCAGKRPSPTPGRGPTRARPRPSRGRRERRCSTRASSASAAGDLRPRGQARRRSTPSGARRRTTSGGSSSTTAALAAMRAGQAQPVRPLGLLADARSARVDDLERGDRRTARPAMSRSGTTPSRLPRLLSLTQCARVPSPGTFRGAGPLGDAAADKVGVGIREVGGDREEPADRLRLLGESPAPSVLSLAQPHELGRLRGDSAFVSVLEVARQPYGAGSSRSGEQAMLGVAHEPQLHVGGGGSCSAACSRCGRGRTRREAKHP